MIKNNKKLVLKRLLLTHLIREEKKTLYKYC